MIRYADEDVTLKNTIKFETYVDVKRFHQKENRLKSVFTENKPGTLNQFVDDEL